MGVGKKDTAGRETVKIRCLGLRMTAKTSNPIVQIIDGDKKDIGFVIAETVAVSRDKESNQ